MARNEFYRRMKNVGTTDEPTKRVDNPRNQGDINQQLTECIKRLTGSYKELEKSINTHQDDLTNHEKRLVALEQWAEKCSKATADQRTKTQAKTEVESPSGSPAERPKENTTQPQKDVPDKGVKTSVDAGGYPVEDGPRVMYKYHQRIRNDAGKTFDVWSGPKLTRAEAEVAGSGLTQEVLAWIKDGKIVLIEPIASREKL